MGWKESANNMRTPRWDDGIEWFKMPPAKYFQTRLVGDTKVTVLHWLTSKRGKPFGELCLNWDFKNQQKIDGGCLMCSKLPFLNPNKSYITHGIIRDIQKIDQSACLKPITLSYTCGAKIVNIIDEFNEGIDINDPIKGMDIKIKYDPAQTGQGKYDVQHGGARTPLRPEELQYTIEYRGQRVRFIPFNAMPRSKDDVLSMLINFGYLTATGDLTPMSEQKILEMNKKKEEKQQGQQPAYQQPMYQQPTYQQPVYTQPQPSYQAPVQHPQQTAYPQQQPVYQAPVQQPAQASAPSYMPPPVQAAQPAPHQVQAAATQDAVQVPPNCPSKFGSYAGTDVCLYTCKVTSDCVAAMTKSL